MLHATNAEQRRRQTRQARRAALAVALAPVLALLGLMAVVSGLIEPGTALALGAACTVWVVVETRPYQDIAEPESGADAEAGD